MPNNSSTGGFLAASSVNGDVNDDALIDFLQTGRRRHHRVAGCVGATALAG